MVYLIACAVLFFLGNSYRDILHCNKKPFYLKGLEEDSSIMDAYIVHSVCAFPFPFLNDITHFLDRFLVFVILIEWLYEEYIMQLNHVFRTRDLVTKNDAKLAKHPEIADNDSLAVNFLDHGYTRPKVVLSVCDFLSNLC